LIHHLPKDILLPSHLRVQKTEALALDIRTWGRGNPVGSCLGKAQVGMRILRFGRPWETFPSYTRRSHSLQEHPWHNLAHYSQHRMVTVTTTLILAPSTHEEILVVLILDN